MDKSTMIRLELKAWSSSDRAEMWYLFRRIWSLCRRRIGARFTVCGVRGWLDERAYLGLFLGLDETEGILHLQTSKRFECWRCVHETTFA